MMTGAGISGAAGKLELPERLDLLLPLKTLYHSLLKITVSFGSRKINTRFILLLRKQLLRLSGVTDGPG